MNAVFLIAVFLIAVFLIAFFLSTERPRGEKAFEPSRYRLGSNDLSMKTLDC
jgi:hypothetical protein